MFPLLALPLLAVTVPTYQVAQSSPNASVADILPVDTPLVGLVNTKAADWNALSRFQLSRLVYTGVKSFLPSDINFNYARDVDSWLGDEVALVLLPKVGTAQVTQDSNFVALAPVKDESRLQQLLASIKPNKQQTITQQQYKGVTILEFKTQPASTPPSVPSRPPKSSSFAPLQFSFLEQLNLLPRWVLTAAPLPQSNPPQPIPKQPTQEFAIALLPGVVVAASSPKPIQQLLDLPKGSETLAQNPNFQRTIQRPQVSPKLFTLYEDPNKFLPLLNSLVSSQSTFPFPNSFRSEQVKDYSSVDGFVLVQPEGLRFQVNAYRQTPKTDLSLISPAEANQILERIPASSYSVSNSRNLNLQWQTAIATISAEPKLKPGLTELRNFVRTTTGLDLDRDIVAWMDGNYALFAYPTKGGIAKLVDSKFNLGVGFLVQTSDRAAAEAALKKLDRFINSSSRGGVTAINRSVKGIPVTSWEIKGTSNDGVLAYSWVDNDTLLITTGLGAIADLVPPSYQSLPKAYTFTTATNSLPSPNKGYFYINTGSLLSWAYGFIPPSQSNDPYLHVFKQIAGTINSVSATSSATAEQEQFNSLVVLAPARAPNKVLP